MLFKICFTESAEKKPPKLQKLCELPSVQQTLSIQVIGTHLVHVVGVVVLIIVVVQSEGGCAFPGFDDNLVHHRLVGLVTSPLLRYVLLVVHRLLSTLALPVTETQQDSTELSQISDGCVSDKEAVCVCVCFHLLPFQMRDMSTLSLRKTSNSSSSNTLDLLCRTSGSSSFTGLKGQKWNRHRTKQILHDHHFKMLHNSVTIMRFLIFISLLMYVLLSSW